MVALCWQPVSLFLCWMAAYKVLDARIADVARWFIQSIETIDPKRVVFGALYGYG